MQSVHPKSGHQGVSWNSQQHMWKATKTLDGLRRHLGYYPTIAEAATVVETTISQPPIVKEPPIAPRLRKFFILVNGAWEPCKIVNGIRVVIDASIDPLESSEPVYRGVRWDTEKNAWQARIRVDGILQHIGYYKSAKKASLAFIRANKFLSIEDKMPLCGPYDKVKSKGKRMVRGKLAEDDSVNE